MLYIAYGSNINLRQMAHRCPGARVVGPAELTGYDLLFRGSRYNSHATVERLVGGSVPVLLWEIDKAHEQALDVCEGWPNVYRKQIKRVQFEGKTRQGMMYVMNDADFGYPTTRYYATIREGYESAGFDTCYLDRAVEQSRQLALEQDAKWAQLAAEYEQELDSGQQSLYDFNWW